MSEDGEFFGMKKEDTYLGSWEGIRDWDTYTGEGK